MSPAGPTGPTTPPPTATRPSSVSEPGVPELARRIDQLPRRDSDRPVAAARELIGGGAVQVHPEHERRLAGIALRKQRAEQTREDVAHSGARHAGIAPCVDEPVTVARHHHASLALPHDRSLEFLR